MSGVRIESEPRAERIRPGEVFGNRFHRAPQTLVAIYTDRWTLLFDVAAGFSPPGDGLKPVPTLASRELTGAGAVRIELDPLCAYAIRNDGGADLYVLALSDAESFPRVLAEPLTKIAGVDGCRSGWIAVIQNGAAIETRICTSDEDLIALFRECAVVAIDVPIGLADRSPRPCDHHARKVLKHRASCVFPAPLRPVLAANDYAEANRISNHQQQRGISKQGWAIVPKVAQVDRILQRRRELRGRVYEVHPEVSFAMWNGGEALVAAKRSKEGLEARRALVSAHFGAIPEVPRGAREDDVLDALAALWTAERIANGRAQTLGDARVDLTGLPMRIVY